MSKKFTWEPGDLRELGKCHLCKHRNLGTLGCKAFPDEIPNEVLTGDFDHSKPYPGDRGIRFEPKG